MRHELFENDVGIPKNMKPEENMFSAVDVANPDDDPDDNMTLMELGRRSLAQAHTDAQWIPIEDTVDEHDIEDEEEDLDLGQDAILQVCFHLAMLISIPSLLFLFI